MRRLGDCSWNIVKVAKRNTAASVDHLRNVKVVGSRTAKNASRWKTVDCVVSRLAVNASKIVEDLLGDAVAMSNFVVDVLMREKVAVNVRNSFATNAGFSTTTATGDIAEFATKTMNRRTRG